MSSDQKSVVSGQPEIRSSAALVELLREARLKAEAATPAPWTWEQDQSSFSILFGPNDDGSGIAFDREGDGIFIAFARNHIEEICAALEREMLLAIRAKAAAAVKQVIQRMQQDPRVAYLLGPFTDTYEKVTEAYAAIYGLDHETFMDQFENSLKFQQVPPIGD